MYDQEEEDEDEEEDEEELESREIHFRSDLQLADEQQMALGSAKNGHSQPQYLW